MDIQHLYKARKREGLTTIITAATLAIAIATSTYQITKTVILMVQKMLNPKIIQTEITYITMIIIITIIIIVRVIMKLIAAVKLIIEMGATKIKTISMKLPLLLPPSPLLLLLPPPLPPLHFTLPLLAMPIRGTLGHPYRLILKMLLSSYCRYGTRKKKKENRMDI